MLTRKLFQALGRVYAKDEIAAGGIVGLSLVVWPITASVMAALLLADAVIAVFSFFSAVLKKAADQWGAMQAKKQRRQHEIKRKQEMAAARIEVAKIIAARPTTEQLIAQKQAVYAAKIEGIKTLPGVDEDTKQAMVNMLVEEMMQELGQF